MNHNQLCVCVFSVLLSMKIFSGINRIISHAERMRLYLESEMSPQEFAKLAGERDMQLPGYQTERTNCRKN